MSRPGVESTTETTLRPLRDDRLLPYCLVAVGALAAALLGGRPGLVAIAVPFLLALALGLRRRGPVRISARIELETEQVLEGDVVEGRIDLRWSGPLDARVVIHRPHGTAAEVEQPLSWEVPAAPGSTRLPFRLRATRWGRRPAGELWVRMRAADGLLLWTGKVATLPTLRVLPSGERLTRLLDPPEARTVLGAHRSRRQGEGHEFAALRPYAPGDRLRNLNWRATARHRRPYVNRQHQEVSGDVVIVVDAFGDGSEASEVAIARAARAGWALASAHLRVNDRVGLAAPGSAVRWLPPAAGRRAKYALFETLLGVGDLTARVSVADDSGGIGGPVPAAALLIALTDLHDQRMLRTVQRWAARGRSVVVALMDATDRLGEVATSAEGVARRLWALEVDGRRRQLVSLGIPVVTVSGGAPIGPAVSALRRGRRPVAAPPGVA